MKSIKYLICAFFVIFAINAVFADGNTNTTKHNTFESNTKELYGMLIKYNPAMSELNVDVFLQGFRGFINLKEAQKISSNSHIITICDFSISANSKRMWVIDLKQKKLLSNNLVSHGKNSGEEFATNFSNKMGSFQSSLGFYITSETYEGSNGYSLRLLGVDKNLNHLALERAIVMHGAAYCSQEFIEEHDRLGRSFGCPSVPLELNSQIIDWIKEGTCLYIHADKPILKQSKWLTQTPNLLIVKQYNTKY